MAAALRGQFLRVLAIVLSLFVLVEGSVQLIRAQDEDAIVLSEGDVVDLNGSSPPCNWSDTGC